MNEEFKKRNRVMKISWRKYKLTDEKRKQNRADEMLRVAIDTNVLLSAIVDDGKQRLLLLKLLQEHTVLLSPKILAELADVTIRDKFAITDSEVNRFLSSLTKISKIIQDKPRFKIIIEDPDDDVILNAAYNGKADYIITGDKDLLAWKKFKSIKILNVPELLEVLRE